MTPEEKAKDLIDKMSIQYFNDDGSTVNAVHRHIAKLSASICCDEMIESNPTIIKFKGNYLDGKSYWKAVKEIIQTL